MFQETEFVVKTSYNARGWQTYFDEKLVQKSYENTRDKLSLALSRCFDEVMQIVQQEVTSAASRTREFSNPLLLEPLKIAFSRENLIRVDFSRGKIYLDPETAAGSLSDFWNGILYAREVIGGGKGTPAQRSAYWRYFVYTGSKGGAETAGMYEDTIALRHEGWNGLAPYWFWIEYGNKNLGEMGDVDESGGIPFPVNSAQPFIHKIEQRANAVFERTLKEIEFQEQNLVETSMYEFSGNTDQYEPFDILKEFYENGRKYYVYITATRQVGVALPKTYQKFRREAGQ